MGLSWLAKQLSDYQEGFCSTELVILIQEQKNNNLPVCYKFNLKVDGHKLTKNIYNNSEHSVINYEKWQFKGDPTVLSFKCSVCISEMYWQF